MPIVETLIAGLLTSLSKPMVENVGKKSSEYLRLTGKSKREIDALRRTYEEIQKMISHTDMPDAWMNEVAQLCYDAEDILDDIKPGGMKQLLPAHVNSIKKHRVKLEKKLSEPQQKSELALTTGQPQSSALVSRVCGDLRKEQTEIIVELLKSHRRGVSIVGVCGVGKSTLAHLILNDATLMADFGRQEYMASGVFNADNAIRHLKTQELPEGRRVLILLDGFQTIRPNDWQLFRVNYLDKLEPGSKILITTRNREVASVTGTIMHHLHPLTSEECSRLIQFHAAGNENLSEYDLQVIEHNKKEMACKCKGSPLLARHLGLLISGVENRLDKVIQITKDDLWELITSEDILPDLLIEPVFQSHTKRYLAYCSLFPEDHIFKQDQIVELWIAEGLVQIATKDGQDLEQANKHFDELQSHSVFRQSEMPAGEEGCYTMYELFHYLAQNIAPKIFRRIHIGTSNSTSTLDENEFSDMRHMSLTCEYIQDTTEKLLVSIMKNSKGLRTFLLLNRAGQNIRKNPTFFTSLKRLRVLDLSHTNLTDLVSSVSELKHLRYLDLSNTPVVRLTSLAKIITLRVLKLNCCDELLCLPNDFSSLVNLVCLQVNIRGLDSMPPNIGNLRNLQNLDVFTVGKDDGYKITELKDMNKLRNSICITRLENVECEYEAKEARLNEKTKVEMLELEWSTTTEDAVGNNAAKKVLECLQIPKNLKVLAMRKYPGPEFPLWLGELEVCRLLKAIELDQCNACTILPSLRQLPVLETLRIAAMPGLQQLGDKFFGEGCPNDQSQPFRKLKSLEFSDLPKLTQWGELQPGCLPLLSNLQIHHCQSLEILPSLKQLTSLKELTINGCTKLMELPMLPSSLTMDGGILIIDGTVKCPVATATSSGVLECEKDASKDEGSSSQNLMPTAPESDQVNHTAQVSISQSPSTKAMPFVNSTPEPSEPVRETHLQYQAKSENQPVLHTRETTTTTTTNQMNGNQGQDLEDQSQGNNGHEPAPSEGHISQVHEFPNNTKSFDEKSPQKPTSRGASNLLMKCCFSGNVQ